MHKTLCKSPSRLLFVSLFSIALLFAHNFCFAQISITTAGSAYTQNFNTLASSGTSSVMPAGWSFIESGSSANQLYVIGNGSDNTGDTYSFGSTGSSDRALGIKQSSTLSSIFGFKFMNQTGYQITSITITYIGEEWRSASAAEAPTMPPPTMATSVSTRGAALVRWGVAALMGRLRWSGWRPAGGWEWA